MRAVKNLIVASALALLAAEGVAVEVTVTVDVPAGAKPTAENVALAPLPAGKKLAVVLFVDWSYRSPKTALPLAEAFQEAGWRATFFFAGTKDLAESAPRLEALGQEVATNLFDGGINAYRDEMYSYSAQDIVNAIGPLKSELAAVLKRAPITQLVRGHDVPYRERIRAMDYLHATHWYTHYVLLARTGAKAELRLGHGDKEPVPIARSGKLDESVFQQAEQNKARAVILGEGEGTFTGAWKEFLTKHGNKPEYWYATIAEFASSVYIQNKAKVARVKVEGGKAHVTLDLAEDFNPLFLRAPISLDLDGKVVDVPPDTLLAGPGDAELALEPARINLPGETTLKVRFVQRGEAQGEVGSFSVHAPEGFEVVQPGAPGGMTAGGSFRIRSSDKAGPLSFGFVPIVVRAKYKAGGQGRILLAAAELEVRPALSVDVYPEDGVPIAPKGSQTFQVTVDNIRAGPGRGNWKNLRGKFEKFIQPPEGEVKGTIRFAESGAFKVEPAETDLTLAAEGESKTFYFTVTNTAPAAQPYVFWPQIRLAGEDKPILLPYGGTNVYCVDKLGAPALDDQGMLMYASWDALDGGNSPGADKARGRKDSYQGAMGPGRLGPGLLGKALLHNSVCLLDPLANFNESEGTMMYWLRNDPGQTRPLRQDTSERLFFVGTQHPAKNVDASQLTLSLSGRGFLVARMMTIGPTYHELRAPFTKTDDWQHVALTWSCPKKFLRIYVDGQLAKEMTDEQTWYPVPSRRWPDSYGDFFTPLSDDHGTYTSTMRDEFHLYNRPLSAEEIQKHIQQVKAKAKKSD